MRMPFARLFIPAALAAALLLPASAPALSLGGLFGSPVDSELAGRIPQDKRAPINLADYALACANQDVELAKLKEELVDKQADLASLNTKLAKAQSRAAEINLDIAKMQGIMEAGLGKAEDNRKVLDELTSDRAKNENERLGYGVKIEQAALVVRDWTSRVAVKEKTVAEFKSRRSGGDAARPAPRPSVQPTPRPAAQEASPQAEEPLEIINKAPGEAPAQPAAGPEADLSN